MKQNILFYLLLLTSLISLAYSFLINNPVTVECFRAMFVFLLLFAHKFKSVEIESEVTED